MTLYASALGGQYYSWCNAFMGRMTINEISKLRADTAFISMSAITDDIVFHQSPEIVDTKRAMFDSAVKRILLADHTKFERRALHSSRHSASLTQWLSMTRRRPSTSIVCGPKISTSSSPRAMEADHEGGNDSRGQRAAGHSPPDHACGLSTIRSNENAESARN